MVGIFHYSIKMNFLENNWNQLYWDDELHDSRTRGKKWFKHNVCTSIFASFQNCTIVNFWVVFLSIFFFLTGDHQKYINKHNILFDFINVGLKYITLFWKMKNSFWEMYSSIILYYTVMLSSLHLLPICPCFKAYPYWLLIKLKLNE